MHQVRFSNLKFEICEIFEIYGVIKKIFCAIHRHATKSINFLSKSYHSIGKSNRNNYFLNLYLILM